MPVVATQLATLADFAPDPLTIPALLLWATVREPAWPQAESAWESVFVGDRITHRVEADHWSLLADPSTARVVAAHIRDFVGRLALGRDRPPT